MPRITAELKTRIIAFLERHRDELKYAKNGYIARLLEQLKEEESLEINAQQLKRVLDYFRLTCNCPLEYVTNSHYKPIATPKRNYRISVPAQKETDNSD